jgi:hypothetical protein
LIEPAILKNRDHPKPGHRCPVTLAKLRLPQAKSRQAVGDIFDETFYCRAAREPLNLTK